MLNLDTAPLTELSSCKDGAIGYRGYKVYMFHNGAWFPVGHSQVVDLVWEGKGYWLNATTPVGTFNIGLDALYDDYEFVVFAYDFNYTIIFRGEKSDEQSLLRDIETAKQLCQDRFNELVLACLK